jgi:hypothetical protein
LLVSVVKELVISSLIRDTFLGLGDVLQSYDSVTKTLELELGDMKDHGMYRIVAVDNDLISFVDARLPSAPSTQSNSSSLIPLSADDQVEWPAQLPVAPVILITNPKDSRFAINHKEPLHRIQSSTHIRFLVFTDAAPEHLSFEILVDGNPVLYSDNLTLVPPLPRYVGDAKNPLWTIPWQPSAYRTGSHVLSIQATTANGLVGESTVVFRTDARRTKIGGGAGEWIISTHMSTLVSLTCPRTKKKKKKKKKRTNVSFLLLLFGSYNALLSYRLSPCSPSFWSLASTPTAKSATDSLSVSIALINRAINHRSSERFSSVPCDVSSSPPPSRLSGMARSASY